MLKFYWWIYFVFLRGLKKVIRIKLNEAIKMCIMKLKLKKPEKNSTQKWKCSNFIDFILSLVLNMFRHLNLFNYFYFITSKARLIDLIIITYCTFSYLILCISQNDINCHIIYLSICLPFYFNEIKIQD